MEMVRAEAREEVAASMEKGYSEGPMEGGWEAVAKEVVERAPAMEEKRAWGLVGVAKE